MLHNRKLWPVLLVLCLFLNLTMPVIAAQKESSGAIIPLATPIPVYTAADLNNVRNNLSGHYIQMADIDLGTDPWNAGDGWLPIGNDFNPFSGTYNGNGYSIANLTIIGLDRMYVGLFGITDSIASEHLLNIHLENVSVSGFGFVGGLAGSSNGPIVNCQVSGSIDRKSVV